MGRTHRSEGFPSHVTKPHSKAGAKKRNRKNCANYCDAPKGHCYKFGICHGVSNCIKYVEVSCKNQKEPSLDKKTENRVLTKFAGVKKLSIKDIRFNSITDKHMEMKVREAVRYYHEHNVLEKPIVVTLRGGNYYLVGHEEQYLAAKQLELVSVPCEMGNKNVIQKRDQYRRIGALLWGKDVNDVGEVIEYDPYSIRVRYDSGKVRKYNLILALSTGTVRLL